MQYKNKIIVIGYSGHAYVLIEAAIKLKYQIEGYLEKSKKIKNPYNLKYLGSEKDNFNESFYNNFLFCVGIGDNKLRNKISIELRKKNCKLINIFHPNSSIFSETKFGTGIFVARNAVINPFCEIGNDVIINTSSTIDHECKISDGSHIAPGAVLLGNVKVGKKSFVGANTVVKEGVVIGDNVTIGAGSVILKNVENNSLYYGNPGKKK